MQIVGRHENRLDEMFQGYLDKWSIDEETLELRLSTGFYHPDATEGQVLYVRTLEVKGLQDIEQRLSEIVPYETDLYVEDPDTESQVMIHVEYAEPLVLRGSQVSVRLVGFELSDYKRFAQQQFGAINDLHESLRESTSRINSTKQLLAEQSRRVSAKAQGHEKRSTARTLYDQHLDFINRLLSGL